MGKLSVFTFVTLNGFYKGPNEDITWHGHGAEEAKFSMEGIGAGNTLLFGRVTYEMMASFWPTPEALKTMPEMAAGMNKADKIVFSRTLKTADWDNTRIIPDNMIEEVRKLKQGPGKDMTLLGSGTILTQFADAGLIDAYTFMLDPVALGDGTPAFKGLKKRLDLTLESTRSFGSGTVLLNYVPKVSA